MTKRKIPGTDEAWDSEQLGADEKHVKAGENSFELTGLIDENLKLKAISIRMKESLIDDLKLIARKEGMGYQPLMKQVLERFVDAELKLYARQHMCESVSDDDSDEPTKKLAACG